MDGDKLHIVMIPWLAFSHLNPCFELAKLVARLGHRVSFLSTAASIHSLAPNVPSTLSHLLVLVPLEPSPVIEEDAAGDGADGAHITHYFDHFDALEQQFVAFLAEASPPPDWVLYDCTSYWAPRAARARGLSSVYLGLPAISLHGLLGPPSGLIDRKTKRAEELTVQPGWFDFPTSVVFRPHEARQVFDLHYLLTNRDGISSSVRHGLALDGADVVGMRSCTELDSEWLALLASLYEKPVLPVGHFTPAVPERPGDWAETFEWLDGQAAGSVVYVAFGSEIVLTGEQVKAIASGLEGSKLGFIWALKPPQPEALPEGFEERTRGRGLVCKGWVPQVSILGHAAIGGFMTHCGWSSIVEALQFGVALVMLPFMNDAGPCARHMADKILGLEVPREEDGSFDAAAVAETVRLVMVEEKGKACRTEAKELAKVLSDREAQERYVEDFVGYMEAHRREAKKKKTLASGA